jgi:hypothetical protein
MMTITSKFIINPKNKKSMKKIFKYLPLALAGFALASCSSDDLKEAGQQVQHNPNALKIVAEGLEDANYTRAGAISTSTWKSTTLKWNTNDVLRVYDNTLSMWDKYTFSGAEFEDNVADFVPAGDNSLTSFSLGAFPADNVESAYLDKDDKTIKHLEMTVPDYYDYTDRTFPDGTVGYRSDLPMYGNISALNSIAEMNYLTAMLRVNMLDVPANTKYLVLVDASAVRNPLAGRFIADIDGTTPPVLKKNAKFAANQYQKGIIAKINPDAFKLTPASKDSAGIFLPVIAGQNYTDLKLYAVINPAKAPGAIGTAGDIRDDIENNTFAAVDYLEIAHRAWDSPARKKVWWVRYTNTCYIDTDVLPGLYPGHITAALNEHTKSIGELVIKPYSASGGAVKPLNPKEGDQFYHQIIIPNMINGCKVTLDLSECGVNYTEALQIYRNTEDATLGEFKGDFKIIPGAKAGSLSAKIEVKLPGSNVEIVTDNYANALPNIDIQEADQTTIGDGITGVDLNGQTVTIQKGVAFIKDLVNMTGGEVIAKRYAGDATQYPTKITVEGGATVDQITNKCKCDIDVIGDGAKEAHVKKLECSDVTEAINIYSEGKANIEEIICPNNTPATGTGGAQLLTIKSKLTNQAANTLAFSTTAATAGVSFGLPAATPAIYTAAQLVQAVAGGIAVETYIMADEIDLNNLPWVGLTNIAANLYGYNQNTATDTWKDATVNAQKVVRTATGKNIIKNMTISNVAADNGFAKNITAAATIAGLEFENPKFSGSTKDQIGVLSGVLSAAAAVNIKNIKVTGLDFDNAGGNAVAGLIGDVTAATAPLTITNVNVAATQLKARSFVSGMIGRVANTAAAINFVDCAVDVTSFGLHLADGATTLYPIYAGTFATYVGGTENNPAIVLDIKNSTYGTAISKEVKGGGINNVGLRFGANANATDVPFFGGNPWIGFCGLAAGGTAATVTIWTKQNDAATNYKKFTYNATTLRAQTYTGGGAAYTGGTNTNDDWYDGTTPATSVTVAPTTTTHNPYRYGLNIYSIYTNSELGYDNDYIE